MFQHHKNVFAHLRATIGISIFSLLALFSISSFAGPGTIIVELNVNVAHADLTDFNRQNGVTVVKHYGNSKLYVLSIPAPMTSADIIVLYENSGLVEYAESNGRGKGGAGISFNDTYFAAQWHTNNIGKYNGINGADINADAGWILTTGSSDIVIAVLDTGIQADHPEFIGRLVPGYDFVNNDTNPEADNSHGVYVSAILAANADNNFGMVGIDHHARIMPLKVLDDQAYGSTSDLAAAIRYAANNGADVISMSLAGYKKGKALNKAIKYARSKGVIMVACAGNDGVGTADSTYKWAYPGAYPQTISVGLTDHRDARVSYSSTGPNLDVVAPGFLVPTAVYKGDPAPMNPSLETNGFGDYITNFEGCSAATPVVAGVVSLMLSIDPSLTYRKIRRILRNTADDQVGPINEDTPGRDDFYGWGRINMGKSLNRVLNTIGLN
ncbi:MAG: S8 family serine peptidase [Thiohalomonadales bacterium]